MQKKINSSHKIEQVQNYATLAGQETAKVPTSEDYRVGVSR